jgi:hypothetical protein
VSEKPGKKSDATPRPRKAVRGRRSKFKPAKRPPGGEIYQQAPEDELTEGEGTRPQGHKGEL